MVQDTSRRKGLRGEIMLDLLLKSVPSPIPNVVVQRRHSEEIGESSKAAAGDATDTL